MMKLKATGAPAESIPNRSRESAGQALAAQLRADSHGLVRGNRIYYADRVFVAVDAGTYSLSQCSSGQFCIWSSTSYTGSFIYKTGQDVTRTIETSVGSFYNHRAHAARLYSNTGASSTCYDAQVKKASVSASYNAAEKVYLSDTTSC
jgi:hypothetical protein